MNIELIGFMTIALGLIGAMKGPVFVVLFFQISLLFGAAAGIILTGFGSANLMPAHLLLIFMIVAVLNQRGDLQRGLQCLSPDRAGFWLLVTVCWGVLTALFMPRLFAGATEVFTVARSEAGPGLMRVPLGPVTGNVTQTIYIVGDLFCFIACYSFASTESGLAQMAKATLFCAALNLVFACADVLTYLSGTADVLSFMRNATYRMLDESDIVGMKRVVGSFPESSTFAYATLGFFSFTSRLWLAGLYPRISGPLGLLSLTALAFSTSTTAYAGMSICVLGLYLSALLRLLVKPANVRTAALVFVGPVCAAALLSALLLYEPLWAQVQELIGKTVLQKAASSSAIERAMWNQQALTNFQDTLGLGAGVGSVRASSFLIAVPASIGVLGSCTYAAFLYLVLVRRRPVYQPYEVNAVQAAARFASFAQLAAGVIAGTFIDLGLSFFVFAAMAVGMPIRAATQVPQAKTAARVKRLGSPKASAAMASDLGRVQ